MMRLNRERLVWQIKIQATASDQAISGISILSNTPIITGVDYPVIELVKMSLIHSSNVATTMLANFLNNDADGFIDSMNAKAKRTWDDKHDFYWTIRGLIQGLCRIL